jgi:hypothetical protein
VSRDITITAHRDGEMFRYVVTSRGRFIREGWTSARSQREAIDIARAEHLAMEEEARPRFATDGDEAHWFNTATSMGRTR